MKFAPKKISVVAGVLLLLLLSGCSASVPNPAKIVVGDGMPKPTQTTWATPEPTPTESAKSSEGLSVSTLPECEKLDKATVYRFQKSGVKCPQLLELRARIVQEVGEEMADWALLAYHSENCTKSAGKPEGEQAPYDPSKKSHGEQLLYKVKPGESKTPTGNLGDGERYEYAPCRTPKQ